MSASGKKKVKKSRTAVKNYGSLNQPGGEVVPYRSAGRSLSRQPTVVYTGPQTWVNAGSTMGMRSGGDSETKGMDTPLTIANVVATVDSNQSMIPLNLVAPGTGSYNRVGRKIFMQSVRIKGLCRSQLKYDGTTGDILSNTLRCLLVYDSNPNGVLPVFNEICGRTVQNGGEDTKFMDPLRFDNTGRFRILREWVWEATPLCYPDAGTARLLVQTLHLNEFVDLKGLPTNYSGQNATCTIADISSGGLYFVARARANGTDDYFNITDNLMCRLRYTD